MPGLLVLKGRFGRVLLFVRFDHLLTVAPVLVICFELVLCGYVQF